MNRRRVLAIVTAVLLALIGTFVIIAYIGAADERALQGRETVRVLVARETIAPDVPAAELDDFVDPREVPASIAVTDGAVQSLADLGDQVTRIEIPAGLQLVEEQFAPPGEAGPATPADDIPQGLEVIAISLERERALGGQVAEDDLVGVVITIDAVDPGDGEGAEAEPRTAMTLNSVPVVRVTGGVAGDGEADAAAGNASDGMVTVWLLVEESHAERIVFGKVNGDVWLTDQGEGINREPQPDVRDQDNIFRDLPRPIRVPGGNGDGGQASGDADSGQEG